MARNWKQRLERALLATFTQDHMENEVRRHPDHWRPVLDIRLPAVADCLGRVEVILHQCQRAVRSEVFYGRQPPLTSLMLVKERCQQELVELKDKLTCLRAQRNHYNISRSTLTERPTLYQMLLNLALILRRSDYPVVRNLRKEDTASWKLIDWKSRCDQASHLSNDDYEGLALTLGDFSEFEGIELTAEKLKNQSMALMAGLRAIVGEITREMVPPKSDEFSVSANIMILCGCLGIFAITPELKDNICYRTELGVQAAELSLSPLYRGKRITIKKVAGELDRTIRFLQPKNSSKTAKDDQTPSCEVFPHIRSPAYREVVTKRPSRVRTDGAGNEKRRKFRDEKS
ncbi:conserved hypothetical protein [Histoplasma capsulatum H143]|uniref:Uncharacterized protein n=1 Tax=Ajellomyces capsulatus (strain H143) TaxID=544712 RepID=C6HCJ5_AJECH|nr:conserved hypothetical protein [Histoplasma capsulatum H143]